MMTRLSALLIWLCICSFSLSLAQSEPPSNLELAKEVHRVVNQYRKSIGLNELKARTLLNEIALKHSRDMATGRLPFSHQGFDDRAHEVHIRANVPYKVSENLYAYKGTRDVARMALKDWINSPGHKKNLEGKFIYTGIAVVQSADGEYFITQLFVGKK